MKKFLSLLTLLWIPTVAIHAKNDTFQSFGGFDSGGGQSQTQQYNNHGSVGGIALVGTVGELVVRGGLLEILYPKIRLNAEEDSDGNGLPDSWELEHFGYIGVDANADADGDGTSNIMEWLAGTDPKDPSSFFRVSQFRHNNDWILQFPTVNGRTYQLLSSTDLETWKLLTQVSGDGQPMEFVYDLGAAGAVRVFLRLGIYLGDAE